MKRRMYTLLLMFAAIFMLISLACGLPSSPAFTPTPKPKASNPQVNTPQASSDAIHLLDDVKNATIYIESQGTYMDFQDGKMVDRPWTGSGFIIDPSGIAVTNNHVVTGAALLKVWIGGDKVTEYNAKVLGVSECSDLAVIKIEGTKFPYLQWYDGQPKVGMQVYSAGFPLGDPEYTLTEGIISKANADGKMGWASVSSVVEHTATINPGNSGGPLVDKDGSVVGINFAANMKTRNQNYAIARAEIDKVLGQLQQGNDVTSIGVNGSAVVSSSGDVSGILVSSVKSGSPADRAGVKPGDFIYQMEGLKLASDGSMGDYCQILRSHKPTDTLSLTVYRLLSEEFLEGQLNGPKLVVVSKNEVTETPAAAAESNSGVTRVSDDSNKVSAEGPNDWHYVGTPWKGDWTIGSSSYPFTAQQLILAPDIDAYENHWNAPGITISTSRDWGKIGGFANLLDGVSGQYTDCTAVTPTKITLGDFEGMVQVYNYCKNGDAKALVYALRPIENSQAYLLLIQEQYVTEEEQNILDAIMGSVLVDQ